MTSHTDTTQLTLHLQGNEAIEQHELRQLT